MYDHLSRLHLVKNNIVWTTYKTLHRNGMHKECPCDLSPKYNILYSFLFLFCFLPHHDLISVELRQYWQCTYSRLCHFVFLHFMKGHFYFFLSHLKTIVMAYSMFKSKMCCSILKQTIIRTTGMNLSHKSRPSKL